MDWLNKLTPSHKVLILTGTGVSAAFLSYSIYQKYQAPSQSENGLMTGGHSPVPVREASSWLKDDIGGSATNSPEVVGASKDLRAKEEVNSPRGWLTPTPSNGNLICHEVQNAEEMFERVSPRGPTESTCIDDFEVDSKASRKVLILGLEQSGKSALLSQISKEGTDCSEYLPTKGFNVVCISFDKIDLNIWEVGGAVEYRFYWRNFQQSTDLILFAVDASDRARFPAAKKYFNDIISEANEQSDFHIIATKSDVEGAAKADEIQNALGLDGMSINVIEVAVRTGGAEANIGLEEVQQCCLVDVEE